MIRIVRSYTTQSIPAGFCGAKRIAKQRLLLNVLHAGAAPGDLKFNSSVWKPAKPALKKETGGKCAYCEAPAGGRVRDKAAKGGLVAHCDVEHFRPKDRYWWLAHNFENYTYSCQVCNQSFKNNQFPVVAPLDAPFSITGTETNAQLDSMADVMAPDPLDAAARGVWDASLLLEDADLSDPLHENPEEIFKYTVDETLGEVSIAPKANSGRRRARALSTIAVIGLDREELRFARYDTYQVANTFRIVLADNGISPATRTLVVNQLSRSMSYELPFAGMVRYFVNDVWLLGIPVPQSRPN